MSEARGYIESITVKTVANRTGCCRSTIYEMLNPRSARFDETFPRPFKIGRRSLFVASEIDSWLAKHLMESRI